MTNDVAFQKFSWHDDGEVRLVRPLTMSIIEKLRLGIELYDVVWTK